MDWRLFAAGLADTFWEHIEVSFFIQIFSIVASVMLISCERPKSTSELCRTIFLGLFSLLGLIGLCCSVIYWGESWFEPGWMIVQILYLGLILLFANHFRGKTRLLLFFEHLTVLAVVMATVNFSSRIGSACGVSDQILWFLRSFSSLLEILCAALFRRWSIERYAETPASVLALAGVIAGISVGFHMGIALFNLQTEDSVFFQLAAEELILFLFLALLVVDLIYSYMVWRTCDLQDQLSEMQVSARDRKRLDELMTVSEQNAERMKEVRHDIKNQFAYLNVLAGRGEWEAAQKYLQEISFDFLQPFRTVDCGNRSMDAILTMELAKADSRGIPLDFQVIIPEKLPIKDSDLCSLAVNVIDNALEGWIAGESGEGVQVRMVMQGEELLFCVTNPTDKDRSFLEKIHTTKDNRDAHGYGTRIIRRIIDKYHGYSEYEIADGRFSFNCILNVTVHGRGNHPADCPV